MSAWWDKQNDMQLLVTTYHKRKDKTSKMLCLVWSMLPTRGKNPLNNGFFKQNIHIEGKGIFFVKYPFIKEKLLFDNCTSYFIRNLNKNPFAIGYLRYVILF